MAVYRIFPSQDAAVYSEFPLMNTGIDEILEVGNYVSDTTPQVARTYIQFANQDVISAVDLTGGTYTASLGLYMAKVSNLASTTPIEVYALTGSWQNGTGRFGDVPQTTDGVSWTSSLASGSFITSQSFGYRTGLDFNANVTEAVKEWYVNPYTNNGFVLKLSGSFEFSPSSSLQPDFRYFSVDTNTIYPPYLEFKWNDRIYNSSGSIYPIIGDTELLCDIDNLGSYYPGSIQRFYVNCRPQYPPRFFTTASLYTQKYLMPSASYYSVVDLKTNDIIFDFDEATAISVSPSASYFEVNMNGLQPERWYQIQIKTEISGSTLILSNPNNSFKVINR